MFDELWKDEEWKAKKIKSIKEDWQRPEYREAQVERVREEMTERWKDPDYKKKVSNSLSVAGKNKWADPEYRIYMITKMAEARERRKGKHK